MIFVCRLGVHAHRTEEKANRCERCAIRTRMYFKAISDAELIAQGMTPLPNDYRGDGARMAQAQNGVNAPRRRRRDAI